MIFFSIKLSGDNFVIEMKVIKWERKCETKNGNKMWYSPWTKVTGGNKYLCKEDNIDKARKVGSDQLLERETEVKSEINLNSWDINQIIGTQQSYLIKE